MQSKTTPRRRGVPRRPVAERFWAKVNKNGPVVRPELGPCWVWTGARTKAGYGTINSGGKSGVPLYAHRVSYELAKGLLPPNTDACHRCDNPPCVRPVHLFAGTRLDNAADAHSKGRLAVGSAHGQAKVDAETVRAIRARYRTGGVSQATIAREYGVSQMTISKIVRRETWAHVT